MDNEGETFMDPDETLRLLRLSIKQMLDEDRDGIRDSLIQDVADYFAALDAWMMLGGFLPSSWGRP